MAFVPLSAAPPPDTGVARATGAEELSATSQSIAASIIANATAAIGSGHYGAGRGLQAGRGTGQVAPSPRGAEEGIGGGSIVPRGGGETNGGSAGGPSGGDPRVLNPFHGVRDVQRSHIRRRFQEEALRKMRDLCRKMKDICSLIMGHLIFVAAIFVSGVWFKALWITLHNLYSRAPECDQPVLTYFMLVDLAINLLPCMIFGITSPLTLRLLWGGPLVWALVGLALVQTSHNCQETSPQLFGIVAFYVRLATATYALIFVVLLLRLGDVLHMPWEEQPAVNLGRSAAEVMASLPTVKAGSEELINKEDGEFSECLICFSSFAGGEEPIKRTRCEHYWHERCLSAWCRTHQTCPLCRAPLHGSSLGTDRHFSLLG